MPSPLLSILIPVYCYDCRALLDELNRQAKSLDIEYEIILGDDHSLSPFRELYGEWEQAGLCILYRGEQNVGAGIVRNELIARARGTWLLLLDSDVLPDSSDFLDRYLRAVRGSSAEQVYCGGFRYPDSLPSKDRMLRYRYGVQVESRSLAERQAHPYRSFVSMSFMMPRQLRERIAFDTSMGMGYEDAYFGWTIEQQGVEMIHIDAPVVHQLKETSEQFLATTERYIANLAKHREKLRPCVRLLLWYEKLSWMPLASLFVMLRRLLRSQLLSSRPSMKLFALYKLLCLASLIKRKP